MSKHFSIVQLVPGLGAFLEWYEFSLFIFLMPVMSPVFFPSHDPFSSLMLGFMVFSTGYFARPVGGLLFGYLGDRYGRLVSLQSATAMMALSMLMLMVLPTYATWGVVAVVLLFFIRVLQGISLGGEYTSALVMLLEKSLLRHRALITSSSEIFSGCGFLLSSATVTLLYCFMSTASLQRYGWRLAYLFGVLLALLMLYLQSFCSESEAFLETKHHSKQRAPLSDVIRYYKLELCAVALLTGFLAVPYYLATAFIPNFLIKIYHFPQDKMMMLVSWVGFLYLFFVPLSAIYSDRIRKRKPIMLVTTILFIVMAYPVYRLIATHHLLYVFTGMLILLVIYALQVAVFSSMINELFPVSCRLSGLSLGYNIGSCLFGGTLPLVSTYLMKITHLPSVPFYYLVVFAFVNLFVLFFLPETHPQSLPLNHRLTKPAVS